jgi:hypothetical protein
MLLLIEELMFLTTERRPTFSFRPDGQNPVETRQERTPSWLSLTWIKALAAETKDRLTPKNRFKRWSSESYFSEPTVPLAAKLQRLKVDATTFLHEYVGMFSKKVYPYSPFGILDGYDITTSQVCQNFEKELESQGKDTRRASLETWVAKTLDAWMADEQIPIGTTLMTISPRGTLEEGYPGEKQSNYVFINLYQKIGENDFQLIQLTSYEHNQGLAQLQTDLSTISQPYQPVQLPFAPTVPSHRLITQIRQFGPEISINNLEQKVYSDQSNWPVKLEQLPQLEEVSFKRQLDSILTFCAEEFVTLQAQADTQQASAQFDILMEIVREDFLKWVEHHASNYHHLQDHTKPVEPDVSIARIKERWLLKSKDAKSLTSEDKQTLRTLDALAKLKPLGDLQRLASMAHCVVGTPLSFQKKMISSDVLSAVKLENNGGEILSANQQLELQQVLNKLTRIFVKNHQTGGTQIWYILVENPDEAAWYINGCYQVDAKSPIMGPCDVPLYQDSLVNPDWILSESEYWQLRAQAFADTLADKLRSKVHSAQDREQLEYLVQLLTQKLFKISFSDLIAGVTNFREEHLFQLPNDDYQRLISSHQPLLTLEELVFDQTNPDSSRRHTWQRLIPEFDTSLAA